MTRKINLKSFECPCGLLCTSPKTHNEITNEFENFHILKHYKRPEVIDGNNLRLMNDAEQKIHLDQVQKVAERKHKEISKKYSQNKFSLSKNETDIHIEHIIKCELVEAIVKENDGIITLSCPGCGNKLYEVH